MKFNEVIGSCAPSSLYADGDPTWLFSVEHKSMCKKDTGLLTKADNQGKVRSNLLQGKKKTTKKAKQNKQANMHIFI